MICGFVDEDAEVEVVRGLAVSVEELLASVSALLLPEVMVSTYHA